MFDISFSEILVIATVALIILGPERLPKVARTLGHLFGRGQRYVNQVNNDIQREMELEELKKWKTSIEDAGRRVENNMRMEVSKFQEEMEEKVKHETSMTSPPPSGRGTEAALNDSTEVSDERGTAVVDPRPDATKAAVRRD